MHENFYFALSLTLLAWMATGIGSFLIFFSKKFNPKFLAFSLGLSAGVMIYVSFMEILPKAIEDLIQIFPEQDAKMWATLWFFVGIGIIALIDFIVPDNENPHEIKNIKSMEKENIFSEKRLLRMGIFSAIAIAFHNFPEWLATFMAALEEPELWVSIAFAIAIHNIPEWIAVAVPIYYATKNRFKASVLWFASGLAEVVGALLGYFILVAIFPDLNFGYIFAFVAGVMVYISLDELLPTAEEYGEHHIAIGGLVVWMAIMASSLIIL